jgi:enoyl-CoA hydratase/carnithine racemase
VSTAFENLKVTDHGNVRVVSLARIAKKNAMNIGLATDIAGALREAAADDAIRTLVLTNEGDFFCAGVDLNVLSGGGDGDMTSITEIQHRILEFPKPIICAVNGMAVGMGVTILPYFDMVYAGDESSFHTPFVKIGIVLEYGSSYTLPRMIGRQRANELVMRAKPIDAATAADWGLINRAYPKATLLDEVLVIAKDVADNPPIATLKCRDLLRQGEQMTSLPDATAKEWEVLATCYGSEENMKAVMEFFARKKA